MNGTLDDLTNCSLTDKELLNLFKMIEKMGPTEKGHVLFALDALIQKIKIKNIAAL